MAAPAIDFGNFHQLCQVLRQKSPSLLGSREIENLMTNVEFQDTDLLEKVEKIFQAARDVLLRNARVTEMDLHAPHKFNSLVNQALYQADWLETTHQSLIGNGHTYGEWMSMIRKGHVSVFNIPLPFRTYEMSLAALQKFILPIDWVPAELFNQHPDLHEFFA